jgi:hypothetical protein
MSGPRALIGLRHEPHGTPLKFEEPGNVPAMNCSVPPWSEITRRSLHRLRGSSVRVVPSG